MPQLMVHRVGTLDLLQFAQASILSAVQVLRQGSIERSHLHQRAMMSGNFAKNKGVLQLLRDAPRRQRNGQLLINQ